MDPSEPTEPSSPQEERSHGQGRKRRAERRRAFLADKEQKVEQLEFFETPSSTYLASVRSANQRRSTNLLLLFIIIVIANTALFAVLGWWFYRNTQRDLKMALSGVDELHHTVQNTPPPPPPDTSRVDELQKRLTSAEELLSATQSKLAAADERAAQSTRRLAEFAAQISDLKSKPASPAQSREEPVASTAKLENLPPSQTELVLLKERNRLTALADEAIATGARGPYERLWDAMEDPRLVTLAHAARAEILRVQDCFLNGQRVKFYGIQQYQIPVAEIFPDASTLTATQLSDDQMIRLLLDQKQPWQTRVKAAWYLGQRRSTKVGEALVKAIKTDPALDVAAEATFSFEQITGYHAKLFEVKSLEAWWQSYNSETKPQVTRKKSDKPENKESGEPKDANKPPVPEKKDNGPKKEEKSDKAK